MGWYLFWIYLPDSLKDPLSGLLMDMGSVGLVEEENRIGAYFKALEARENILDRIWATIERLRQEGLDAEYVRIVPENLPEQDWNVLWKSGLQPVTLDCGVVILPSATFPEFNGEGINLIIEPGSAFGSGHHETTGRVACLLRKYANSVPGHGYFLDMGTGTGLLAILAARCGFRKIAGLDNDPEAVATAIHNVALNGLSGKVKIVLGSIEQAPSVCSMITANLLSSLLRDFIGGFSERMLPGAVLIASGMLKGQEGDLAQPFVQSGIEPVETVSDGRWVTVVGRKRGTD